MITDGSLETSDPPASGPGQPPPGRRSGVKAHNPPRVGRRVRHGIEAAEDLWHRVVQELYLRAFGLDPRGLRDLLRRLISLGLTVGWLFLTALAGPWARAGGPVLYGIIILVAFTGFWWLSMRFLLGGRIRGGGCSRPPWPPGCAGWAW